MAIYHRDIEQRDEHWFQLRCGIPTASEMDRIITPTGKASKQCMAYMHRLLAEWVLHEPIMSDYESRYMTLGIENEDAAAKAFEFQTGHQVSTVGFVTTDDGLVGCSPDRLVGDYGTLELKCPAIQTHVGYLLDGSIYDEYRVQVQSQLWICELDKAWIVSYHPKLAPHIDEIGREEDFIASLSAAVRKFVDRMCEAREDLHRRFGPFPWEMNKEPDVDPFGVTEEDVEAILAMRGEGVPF